MPSPIGLRWAVAMVALVAEAIWLSWAFQAPNIALDPQWQVLLGVFNNGYHRTAGIIFAAAFLILVSSDIGRIIKVLSEQASYTWGPWAALHGLSLLLFAYLTQAGFGTATEMPALSLAWLAGWAGAATAVLTFWLLILAPAAAWCALVRGYWLSLVLTLAVGSVVWAGGLLMQDLWQPLAQGTLHLTVLLLSLIYPEVSYDATQRLVASHAFMVQINPACSGYEGIWLVSAFVAAYLWVFRRQLSFPRALILFPIGILSIWLSNVLRITALIVVGTSLSAEVADRGFHSQAGWIFFTLVTLGLIAIAHRWLSPAASVRQRDAATAGRPEFALLLPLLVLMATSMVVAATSAGFDALYPLGVVATGTVLWYYRASYRSLFGPWSWEPFAIGTLVFVVWVLLVPGDRSKAAPLLAGLAAWPLWLAVPWIGLRVLGSVVTVAFAEELAVRGYLIRKLVAWDFERVRPGHFTWFSFALSSLLFGWLHQHLLAGTLAGAGFALALYRRGLVGDAILAHATSNALIAVAVLAAGQWGLWA